MKRTSPRATLTVATIALLVGACGGGPLSLSEYAEQGGDLVTTVRIEIDSLDADWESQVPTQEGAREYWDRRLAARVEFMEGFEALEPPGELAEMHHFVADIFTRLIAAERALAARAATYETPTDHGPWWDTAEGERARAVDGEAIAICYAAQDYFDATEQREALADVPWIPPGMKEVVRATFGCPE